MSQYNYAFRDYNKETMARAVGRDLSISTKHAIEICNFIRGKSVIKAKYILNEVMKMKAAIPFTRFTNGPGHRAGNMTSGRYPVSASGEILRLIESAETNAQQKGLNTSRLAIIHLAPQKASRPYHSGRKRGRKMKRTHVEIVLGEGIEEKINKRGARDGKAAKQHEIHKPVKETEKHQHHDDSNKGGKR